MKPKRKLSPHERDRIFAEVRNLWEEGRRKEAWTKLQQQGLFRCRTPAIRKFLAQVYAARGLYEQCLKQTRVLVRKPHELEVARLHAFSLYQLSRLQEALEFLEPLLRDPGPQSTHVELKLYLLYCQVLCDHAQEKALAKAKGVMAVIAEAKNRGDRALYAEATFTLGNALRSQDPGRAIQLFQEAENSFREQGRLNDTVRVLDHRAYALFLSQRLEEALLCYQKEARLIRKLGNERRFAELLTSIADLQMELLRFSRAILALAKVLLHLPKTRVIPPLMLIECEWRLGADPNLLLSFLETHLGPLCGQDSPSPHAYFYFILSHLLWELGRKREAREAMETTIEIRTRTENFALASHALAHLATMEESPQRVRSTLARALWVGRREPDYTVDQLRRWVRGREGSSIPRTPFEEQEALRIRARLSWMLGPSPQKPPPRDQGKEMAKALSRAAQEGPRGILPFLREAYGRSPTALLTLLPGGQWKPLILKGLRLQEALRLEEGFSTHREWDPGKQWKSHIRVATRDKSLLLCIRSKKRFFLFGPRDFESLQEFLELLQPILQGRERGEARDGGDPNSWEDGLRNDPRRRERDTQACPLLEGSSQAIQTLRELGHRFAGSELPLCLKGETGTGKKTFATHLHRLSPRGEGPLVFVDCASLQEGLVESELLGHIRGAFTGAQEDRPGLFQQAWGGTLVLVDPISLPQRGQRLLLGAIESGGFRPLGGSQVHPMNARILCTTIRSLEEGLGNGELQPDLYYRLSGMTLELPSLRERVEDLPQLIRSMLVEERYRGPATIPPGILAELGEEPWPGNLRELRNRVKKALVLSEGGTLHPEFLLSSVAPSPPQGREPEALDLKAALRAFERQSLLGALARFGGHRERTARALGISRRWLQKRIRDLGL